MTLGLSHLSYKLQQEFHVRIQLPVPSPIVSYTTATTSDATVATKGKDRAWKPVNNLVVSIVGVKKFVEEAKEAMIERAQGMVTFYAPCSKLCQACITNLLLSFLG